MIKKISKFIYFLLMVNFNRNSKMNENYYYKKVDVKELVAKG